MLVKNFAPFSLLKRGILMTLTAKELQTQIDQTFAPKTVIGLVRKV